MASADLDEILDVANRLADEAGPVLRRWFRAGVDIDIKSDESPVTRADRETEAAMRAVLAEIRPDDGIIGEEHGTEHRDARLVWVLDPLDGTRAFVIGKPTFGTLIAVAEEGRPLVGIVDMPILGERWIGARGRPTLFRGRGQDPVEVRVRPAARLAEARINTTSPAMFEGKRVEAFGRLRDAALDCHYGGDCHGYGLVASGWLDLTVECSMQVYDYMALVPVVEGAGGTITDWAGAPLTLASGDTVVAAGDAGVHAEAIALLRNAI